MICYLNISLELGELEDTLIDPSDNASTLSLSRRPPRMLSSSYHMLHRHRLWSHGSGAPLCGRHGLILPVLATGQLLLPRLVPLHLWPVEVQTKHRKNKSNTYNTWRKNKGFLVFLSPTSEETYFLAALPPNCRSEEGVETGKIIRWKKVVKNADKLWKRNIFWTCF